MGQTTFSFEIFPPNKESAVEKLTETLDELVGLSPDFISVTCTNKNDDLARLTVKLAGYVKNKLDVPSIAHLPAAYLDKQQVSEILNELETLGVTNLLALRGDRIEGRKPKDDFRHASDLIAYVHENFLNFTSARPAIRRSIRNQTAASTTSSISSTRPIKASTV